MTTSSDPRDRCRELREEFWRGVGEPGESRGPLGDVDEPSLWPDGISAYRQVTTAHAGVVTTDGLSNPGSAGAPALGLELYVESVELTDTDPDAGRWLVAALEECAGAVAGAAPSVADALAEHELLSLEVSGAGAPSDWVSDGRLGVILGIRLPGRSTGYDVDGVRVDALSVTPLRPDELAVIAEEGPRGRQRVAEALASSGWYSYADAERPSVL
ncbi:hypothetical protein [Janibacter sp. DB-40]|uniref:hypothetical protein n=1 Tax=Janibacter sp. DB-40 TaxID=3028808 RepID=UPI002406BC81|nr:hypothetical protein [Janibacter sp. DB-40]